MQFILKNRRQGSGLAQYQGYNQCYDQGYGQKEVHSTKRTCVPGDESQEPSDQHSEQKRYKRVRNEHVSPSLGLNRQELYLGECGGEKGSNGMHGIKLTQKQKKENSGEDMYQLIRRDDAQHDRYEDGQN